ncbi:MAG TPA: hypothetical protein VNK44_02410 [Candidatus Nitrosotenuis sp.]|nr:hypothetical protein [Candidatus Nitrosotenuis sp.]
MRKEILMLPIILLAPAPAFAQMDLWVPRNMITSETYQGLVVLDAASPAGSTISLSVDDPSILAVPESVSVPPYKNHGIFEIKVLRDGPVKIFAAGSGKVSSINTEVRPSSATPAALSVLFASNKTKADTVVGYVLSVDAAGSPATVSKDTAITMTATSTISVDGQVTIKKGTHYARFTATVIGSGSVLASAPLLRAGEAHIEKLQDQVTVKISVAPDIIMENSKAYFYIWLEKDGRPFKPPYTTHAFVSSSNLNSIRFNENPHLGQRAVLKVPLINGIGSGTLVSSEAGSSVITADVEGFGSSQTNAMVGSVLLDENFKPVTDESRVKKIEGRKPNIAMAWIRPGVTDSEAFGILALYHMNATKNASAKVDINGTSILITNSINRVEPVAIDGRTVTLTSSYLAHPAMIVMSESNEVLLKRGIGSNHAVEFKVGGKIHGNHTLTVSGPGLERFQTTVQVRQPYTESYRIGLVPVPALPHSNQDIAILSILDSEGALVDIQRAFGGPIRITVTADSKEEFVIGNKNSAVLSSSLDGKRQVVAAAPGITPYQGVLAPWGVADSIRLDAPSRVHIDEGFPYAVHEIDAYGIPLRKINATTISATPGLVPSGMPTINQVGVESLAVLSKFGADTQQIESFANKMSLQLVARGITNRVNTSFELIVESDVTDAQLTIESPFPYEKTGKNSYSVTPDRQGLHNLTVTALKTGYMPAKSTLQIFSEDLITISFEAAGTDGSKLHVNTKLATAEISKSFATPHVQELRPQFVSVGFPATVEVGTDGYQLQHIEFDGRVANSDAIQSLYVDSNTSILALYQRMVRISAENAVGGGFYPYGSTVTLSVPPKDKVLFFVREVFDHWIGLPYDSDTVTLNATHNIDAKAVLRDDYTILMLSFAVPISSVIYFRFVWRKRLDLLWYVRKLAESTRLGQIRRFVLLAQHFEKIFRRSNQDRDQPHSERV